MSQRSIRILLVRFPVCSNLQIRCGATVAATSWVERPVRFSHAPVHAPVRYSFLGLYIQPFIGPFFKFVMEKPTRSFPPGGVLRVSLLRM